MILAKREVLIKGREGKPIAAKEAEGNSERILLKAGKRSGGRVVLSDSQDYVNKSL